MNTFDADSDGLPVVHGLASVEWLGSTMSQPVLATPALLDQELYLADPCRKGNRYPRQRNYHGQYYFTRTGRHVWFESLLESRMLMLLDWTRPVVAIASQPLKMTFFDGSVHFPDFLALHTNHRQVMYDVKPLSLMTVEAALQFEKTRAVCADVGWGYEVLTGLPEQEQTNLTWLSYFKHHGFHPGENKLLLLRHALAGGTLSFRDCAAVLGMPSLASGRSALYHLLWTRDVITPMALPLTDRTLIDWNPNADA